ncbi:MAG: hypothetical protein J0H69_17105 [Burkholderiales bacterium]|nr:hypothetical protein [Burkholderiales bacterium]
MTRRFKLFRYFRERGLTLWDSLNYSELIDVVLYFVLFAAVVVLLHAFLIFTPWGNAFLVWIDGGQFSI